MEWTLSIRARVVEHPKEWKHCGYHELAGNRKRYRIINEDSLLNNLQVSSSIDSFRKWYSTALQNEICKGFHRRENFWSESLAVGSKNWIESLALKSGRRNHKVLSFDNNILKDDHKVYTLAGSSREDRKFWSKCE